MHLDIIPVFESWLVLVLGVACSVAVVGSEAVEDVRGVHANKGTFPNFVMFCLAVFFRYKNTNLLFYWSVLLLRMV